MKIALAAAAATAIGLIAVPASAQVYGNLGYTSADLDPATVGAITGRLGWQFDSPFAVEGEASVGVKDDQVTVTPPVDAKLKYAAAAYGVARVPVTPNINILGRVGYGVQEIELESAGVKASETEDSINYGVGAEYYFDAQNGVRVDYTRHDFRDSAIGEADAWSIGYSRKF